MALVRRLIARLRNRRGFGVHSPFAFDFIMHTLRSSSDCRYYESENLSRRRRLLYRLVVRLQPSEVVMLGDCSDMRAVLDALGPTPFAAPAAGHRAMGAGLRLVVCGPGCHSEASELRPEDNLLILSPRTPACRVLWQTRLQTARRGMSFSRRNLRVFIADARLPRQDFRL